MLIGMPSNPGGTARWRTASALLRKKGIRLVNVSVQEERVAWSLKGEVQAII